jgi:hypothetical protein
MSVQQLEAPVVTAAEATAAEAQAVIVRLPFRELSALATWFDEYFGDEWDRQIERDALAGRLDHFKDKVKAARAAATLTDR